MKFQSLRNWKNPQNSSGLIFFSQLLEEMLFDFSLDTYKASVMHTGLLCKEAASVIKEIESGNIKLPNIAHVNAEFCAAFEKDDIARNLIPLPSSAFLPILKNPKSSLKEMQTIISFLALHLTNKKYRLQAEKLLEEQMDGAQSITEIRRLTRSYVTALMAEGFDQRRIKKSAYEYFYNQPAGNDENNSIKGFFALFPIDSMIFNVYFRVDSIFEYLGEDVNPIGLKLSNYLPEEIDRLKHQKFFAQSVGAIFAIANDVKAKDIYSAREIAERRLKLCATLLNVFHHKENPSWRADCLVQNTETNEVEQISNPINAMHKCGDLKPENASVKMKALLKEFSLENGSFIKFVRSTQLHSMALSSNSPENQILNLWIALESLVPTETRVEDSSNIEHIVSSIIPFLNINYIEKLLYNHARDLMRWSYRKTRAALNGIEGKSISERLAKLMICDDFFDQRAVLEDCFNDFHLLKDRFNFLKALISNPKNVIAALDAHKLRLEWQIRRIYRTRNIIVHSGHTPQYTQALIEHSHDYLDAVLIQLIKLASKPKTINSVAQGFKFTKMKYDNFYKEINAKNIAFDRSNIGVLLILRQH